MVDVLATRVPFHATHIRDVWPRDKRINAISVLLLCQASAFVIQVLAVFMARAGIGAAAAFVSVCSFALVFASALWALTLPQPKRALRNTAVACLGVTPAVLRWVPNPSLFTDFDEQLHMRTLRDIVSSHGVFQPHPLLGISARYPGMESVAALIHQLGLPVMVAAMVVVLAARLTLVLVLCDAVEQLTGSPRAGGVAVAIYAVSAQFVAFNSQFACQTLGLPLTLAAIAFIARARSAADPRALFGGATVCLLAVAVTDYVSSWLAAAFLACWAITQRGRQARRRVFYGSLLGVAATTLWAMTQWSLLREYFGPIIDDLRSQLTGYPRRGAFSDAAGYSTPLWERFLMVYWAAAVIVVVALLILICARSLLARRGSGVARTDSAAWEPRAWLVLVVAVNPILLALPTRGVEIGDRLGALLFLPLSLLVAATIDRRSQVQRGSRFEPSQHRQLAIIRWLALMLGTGVFAGGYLMGSGPDYAQLPGPYLASADRRSTDAETLAAVRWARDALPPGSRIGADRMSSALLASEAGLWPVMREGDVGVPPLYLGSGQNPRKGDRGAEVARDLRLRYLYVDRRWADQSPHAGWYFYKHETPEPMRLTQDELTRFDNLPGIRTVYRQGPISIYDLSALKVPELRSGWFGKAPTMGISIQVAIGLLAGLALAFVARSSIRRRVTQKVKSFQIAAGTSLAIAAGLATLCTVSITLLLAHVWLGPIVFLSMALGVFLINHRWVTSPLMNGTTYLMRAVARIRWDRLGALGIRVVSGVAMAAKRIPRPKVTLGQVSRKSLVMIAVTVFFIMLFIALGVYDGISMQPSSSQRPVPAAGQQP